MNIESAVIEFYEGRPWLNLVIDGVDAFVPPDHKDLILNDGVVLLYPESSWERDRAVKAAGQSWTNGYRNQQLVDLVQQFRQVVLSPRTDFVQPVRLV